MNNLVRTKASVIQLFALLFMLALVHPSVQAQNNKGNNLIVYPLDTYINSQKKNDVSASILKKLVYEVQPSVYFFEGVVKNYGSNPKSLFTDVKGFNTLSKQDIAKESIELITIRVENMQDLQYKIDFSGISAFPKVKYVYILTSFDCDINSIPKVITNYNENYVVVFKSDKGA